MGVLLFFLDGVGLAAASQHNPLSAATTPTLTGLFGGPLLRGTTVNRPNLLLRPIDATLGVSGLPQSATGQTTLYTGQNAAQFLGRHQSAFANGSLRKLIDEYGLFSQLLKQGNTATLANAYSPSYFYAIANRKRRYSVCTLLNLTAGLPFRMQTEYEQGKVIFWDIVGDVPPARNSRTLSPRGPRQPISPIEAGKRLALLSGDYDLTLFECYLTDYAGHRQDWDSAIACLHRVDSFIQGILTHLTSDTTLLITSDHGNIENLSTKRHTLNPVPLIVYGPQADEFSDVADLTGIAPQVLTCLAR